MRCYFMRGGHIAAVEILAEGGPDAELTEQAFVAFSEHGGSYDGPEI